MKFMALSQKSHKYFSGYLSKIEGENVPIFSRVTAIALGDSPASRMELSFSENKDNARGRFSPLGGFLDFFKFN